MTPQKPIRFGSVASGIEAASVAFGPLGWQTAWVSEIAPFPCAVLAYHYPDVPNLGDMTTIPRRVLTEEVEAPDVLCGGTPCQAFSVAGLRESLADERGNLTLRFVEIADAIDYVRGRHGEQPAVILWENVPGVLSTKDNAFGCFLAGLAGEDAALEPAGGKWTNAGCVYGPVRAVAWRTLDAQYFGLAQRRRRVFVVASARNDIDPAQILFEWDGLRRDSAPSRETRENAAPGTLRCTQGGSDVDHARAQHIIGTLTARGARNGGQSNDDVDGHKLVCMAHGQSGAKVGFDRDPTLTCNHEAPTIAGVTHALRGEGFDASEDGTGRSTPLVPVPFDTTQVTSRANYSNPKAGDPCHPLASGAHAPAIAFPANLSGTQCASTENLSPALGALNPTAIAVRDTSPTLTGNYEKQCDSSDTALGPNVVLSPMQVRRLTPRECERLQGFPDDYTLIPWRCDIKSWALDKKCPDGPRYKALGNSWAVPCVRWIGKRIANAIDAAERIAA